MNAFGLGLPSRNSHNDILEVFYPVLGAGLSDSQVAALQALLTDDEPFALPSTQAISALKEDFPEQAKAIDTLLASARAGDLLLCVLAKDAPPVDIPSAYLKLHLISHRLCKPHGTNLDGMFGVLRNLAWTSEGPIDLPELPGRQLAARTRGEQLKVYSVDKFPPMTDYVVPSGVRIADTARVRLGAYLGEGTTIMHEGFVNFNAGTLGTAMIEGRISAGVIVGDHSDLGGSSSTMGTLSGGGTRIISVGKNCLLGANSGIGIPLGDGCTVEAGLYVTAGTKVTVLDQDGNAANTVKAAELSDQPDLLFRRNSQSGAVECVPKRNAVGLNAALHSN
jgi:2,3,4,5-tetrahydropyridine-2-carboxylate N-succinyltransferase